MKRLPGAEHRAGDVHGEDGVEVFEAGVLDGFAPVRPVQDSRVVDQPRDDAVDGERPVVDRGEHGDDVLLDADVRGKGGRDAAGVDDGRDDAVGCILRSRSMVHGDRPAVAREEPAARGSDPFRPSRHDGDLFASGILTPWRGGSGDDDGAARRLSSIRRERGRHASIRAGRGERVSRSDRGRLHDYTMPLRRRFRGDEKRRRV